jgi:rod shape-determining protein MreD
MTRELRTYALWAVALLALVSAQLLLAGLLDLGTVRVHFVVVGIAAAGLRFGRIPAMLYAFPAGLLLDLYGGEVVGLTSLALCAAGFAAGSFHDPARVQLALRTPRTVWVTAIAAVTAHVILVFAYFRGLDFDIVHVILLYVIAASAYTTVVSAVVPLIAARTGGRLKVS